MAPTTDGPSVAFLNAVLNGLKSSPVLQPSTLSALFSLWQSSSAALPLEQVAGARKSPAGLGREVRQARQRLAALSSVVPTDRFLTTRVAESILLGEAATVSTSQRDRFEQAPAAALAGIGSALSLAGSRTVTLTSRSGQIPVTVQNARSVPVDVVLRLRSSELTFPGGRTRFLLHLTTRAHESAIPVSTLTSGATTLEVSLLSPRGDVVLSSERLSIHSTAISGVGVGLSIGALLVLAIWWARSYARHRRRSPRKGRPASASGTTPASPA